jgi:hypothetical protein
MASAKVIHNSVAVVDKPGIPLGGPCNRVCAAGQETRRAGVPATPRRACGRIRLARRIVLNSGPSRGMILRRDKKDAP